MAMFLKIFLTLIALIQFNSVYAGKSSFFKSNISYEELGLRAKNRKSICADIIADILNAKKELVELSGMRQISTANTAFIDFRDLKKYYEDIFLNAPFSLGDLAQTPIKQGVLQAFEEGLHDLVAFDRLLIRNFGIVATMLPIKNTADMSMIAFKKRSLYEEYQKYICYHYRMASSHQALFEYEFVGLGLIRNLKKN